MANVFSLYRKGEPQALATYKSMDDAIDAQCTQEEWDKAEGFYVPQNYEIHIKEK